MHLLCAAVAVAPTGQRTELVQPKCLLRKETGEESLIVIVVIHMDAVL